MWYLLPEGMSHCLFSESKPNCLDTNLLKTTTIKKKTQILTVFSYSALGEKGPFEVI